jgi:hypothetical protein
MNKFYLICIVVFQLNTYSRMNAQSFIENLSEKFFISANGTFNATKNFDIARYYIQKSYGGEVGVKFLKNTSISYTYEKGNVDEYSIRSKNLVFKTLSIKQGIVLTDHFLAMIAVSSGKTKGKYLNYGFNEQNLPEFDFDSRQYFLDLGARYQANKHLFFEFRFLQFGHINEYIEKTYPTRLKAWVINDDENFPFRLSVGYVF